MTVQPVNKALIEIAKTVSDLEGVKLAPTFPPEGISQTPAAIIYVLEGRHEARSIANRHGFYNIAIDILARRNNQSRDMETLTPYLDLVPQACLDEVSDDGDQFNNTIETFAAVVTNFIPEYQYQDVQYIAYRFVLEDVKFIVTTS